MSKKFKIFKLRTMTALDDGGKIKQAVRGDARVTNIGAWLRKTSIDELPQLFNVLKGEMSIVGRIGPRRLWGGMESRA